MATTATKIVVNAQGRAAAGTNAHFKLLVDGVKVGEGTADTTAKTFTFTATLAADTAHKVQIQYDNDAVINGQDRSLTVNSITIGNKTVTPTDSIVSYDKGALDGRDVAAGQKDMWWNGTLVVNADKSFFPATTTTPTTPTAGKTDTIVVNAQGTPAGGVNAHFKVLVDGKPIGEGTAGTTAKDYTFTTDAADKAAHKVQIQYDNDAVINGQDRSLTVNKITINGHAYNPTDSAVTYDKGALDGRDVVAGQKGMWWNGTLVVNAPASDFPAPGTTPTTPTTPTNPAPTGPAFYVAANGKDSWSGKLAAPNADGTDGPFASLTKAQQAMRADPTIDTTYVRGGDYTLKNVLWLDGQDSGVTIAGYGNEKAVIHGGSTVSIGLGGAKNVTIEGLSFTGGTVDGHHVYADNAAGLTFANNSVTGGGYGITVQNSANSQVVNNQFSGTGAEAIFVKAGSNATIVSNNLIKHPNAADRGDAGIWINGSSDVKVTHNQIEDSPEKAIAVGSVETTGSDATYRATIAFNKVIDANLESNDGGGIYLINRQQTLTDHIVVNNDVTGTTATNPTSPVASWGIYLDDWTSGATVKGNYVHGNIGGVFLHGGWSNSVTDNLIAGNTGAQIGLQQDVAWGGWKGAVMSNNDITGNLIDTSKGVAVHLYGPANMGRFHDNDYTSLDTNARLFEAWPQVMASGSSGTLKNWQAAGYDNGSGVLDAHFVNPSAGDYTLAADSPVYQHGFDVLPFDQMGLLHA
ncbi:carbohydrate-binding domain-containing protein [Azospirillum agricola]|uniref:carbohydrate-binding domain-containing protein n=1 Tax=Azospirillum agricola TaxID=1720247 RepID=UPI000A0F2863|nr:carbohydrate-binding domain-containing protein [Azospirillum agricola]SMH62420.1 parallel beta-helix repeat (two copies) [Azospirillum lipoferum]